MLSRTTSGTGFRKKSILPRTMLSPGLFVVSRSPSKVDHPMSQGHQRLQPISNIIFYMDYEVTVVENYIKIGQEGHA